MSDPCLRFAVYCVGSNKLLAADLQIRFNESDVLESSCELQRQVAALSGVESHQCIKVMLGSPAGPQLTPLLRSLDALIQEIKEVPYFKQDTLLRKATHTAWSKLQFGKVNTVFVTQHKHSALVVDQLVAAYANRKVAQVYNNLPRSTRCNPAVFLTADTILSGWIDVPDELRSNKAFALGCFKRRSKVVCFLGLRAFDELQDDEEVVIAAVASRSSDFQWASPRLKASKSFVLKAVGVNGLCINWVAPDLKKDKDVALAAVRQNTKAIHYLCAELQEDKDVVAARQQRVMILLEQSWCVKTDADVISVRPTSRSIGS
jgi:hypothetical protein